MKACTLSKYMIAAPFPKLKKYCMHLSRFKVKVFTGTPTGHFKVKTYLHRMSAEDSREFLLDYHWSQIAMLQFSTLAVYVQIGLDFKARVLVQMARMGGLLAYRITMCLILSDPSFHIFIVWYYFFIGYQW